jgi:hypothetical protein
MKHQLSVALGLAMLLSAPAFACEADHTAAMMSQLSKSSAQANVHAASLSRKASYCEQNATNLSLRGDEKNRYVTGCMNKNDALELRAEISGRI